MRTVKLIAAIDGKRGLANNHGIPWQGKIPADTEYYRNKLRTGTILMGYGTYQEIRRPYYGKTNYVATKNSVALRPGFSPVHDARDFLTKTEGEIWNIGGAGLFASTIDLADELYLTRLGGDFHCTKFFPEFENKFVLVSASEPLAQNGITFHFEVWKRRQSL